MKCLSSLLPTNIFIKYKKNELPESHTLGCTAVYTYYEFFVFTLLQISMGSAHFEKHCSR